MICFSLMASDWSLSKELVPLLVALWLSVVPFEASIYKIIYSQQERELERDYGGNKGKGMKRDTEI